MSQNRTAVERARLALAEKARRERRKNAVLSDVGVHPCQDAFLLDRSPKVLASCSRRAGKSYGTAKKIVAAMEEFPRGIIPYVVQAREQAKDIIWGPLIELSEKHKLSLRFKENTGEIIHPNGAKCILRGAATKREMEKLRGLKYPLAILDEAQGYASSLKYLVEDIIEPAMMDYGSAAQLCLIGTPNAACAGPFKDMIDSGKYPHYSWTLLDNPFIPEPEKFLELKRKQHGGETPTFLREYKGIWVKDEDALVFRLDDNINLLDENTARLDDYQFTLGIDFGFNDPSAFVVLGHSRERGEIVVFESFEEAGLTQSRIAAYIQELDDKYHFAAMVGDSQGYGKPLVEGLNAEYGMNVKAAKKRDKPAHIEILNTALRTGAMRIVRHKNFELIEQMRVLQWDPDKLSENKFAFLDSKFADHLADALVYGFRDIRLHDDGWEEEDPEHGSSAYWTAKEESWIEARVQNLKTAEEEQEWFDEFEL